MIYTLGKTELYESYFKEGQPKKGIGGSVWRTLEDIWNYHIRNESKEISPLTAYMQIGRQIQNPIRIVQIVKYGGC